MTIHTLETNLDAAALTSRNCAQAMPAVAMAGETFESPATPRPNKSAREKGRHSKATAKIMEEYVIAIAERRDKKAFSHLFEAFAPKLKSFAMRNGAGLELAEEVVQETFIRVWRKAGQFDPNKASASTWIYTIARNQRIDLLRKRHRPEPDFEDPAFVPEAEPQPSELVSRDQETSRLRACMETLSPEQQDVLRLAFMEEMPHVEVAEKLGIPLGTVKSRIRLAMKHIRSEIGDIR